MHAWSHGAVHDVIYSTQEVVIASNVYCNADMQYSARTVQIFVATYVVITFLEMRDVSNSAAI